MIPKNRMTQMHCGEKSSRALRCVRFTATTGFLTDSPISLPEDIRPVTSVMPGRSGIPQMPTACFWNPEIHSLPALAKGTPKNFLSPAVPVPCRKVSVHFAVETWTRKRSFENLVFCDRNAQHCWVFFLVRQCANEERANI